MKKFLPLSGIAVLLLVPLAVAQTAPDLQRGLVPYGAYEGGNLDNVSMTTGNLNVRIPLISYPQRGGKLA